MAVDRPVAMMVDRLMDTMAPIMVAIMVPIMVPIMVAIMVAIMVDRLVPMGIRVALYTSDSILVPLCVYSPSICVASFMRALVSRLGNRLTTRYLRLSDPLDPLIGNRLIPYILRLYTLP